MPSLCGILLQWHDLAFIVGIPASVMGTAYVLTIRDPKNYTGFYGGIIMALLLSIQFYLQGNMDLVLLQLLVFVPFLLSSLLRWRRLALQPQSAEQPFVPEWLPRQQQCLSWFILLIIVAGDYILATLFIQQNACSIPPNPKCNDKIDIFFILPPKIIITLLKLKENKKSSNATFVFIIDLPLELLLEPFLEQLLE